jgi:hypothetical protein
MHSLKVTPIFLIVDYGGISIATARGRLTPEVTSPIDIIYRFDVISAFVSAENGRKTI